MIRRCAKNHSSVTPRCGRFFAIFAVLQRIGSSWKWFKSVTRLQIRAKNMRCESALLALRAITKNRLCKLDPPRDSNKHCSLWHGVIWWNHRTTVVEAFEQVRKWSLQNTGARFSVKPTRDIRKDVSQRHSAIRRESVHWPFPKPSLQTSVSVRIAPCSRQCLRRKILRGIRAFVPFNGLRRNSPNCGFPSHSQSEFHAKKHNWTRLCTNLERLPKEKVDLRGFGRHRRNHWQNSEARARISFNSHVPLVDFMPWQTISHRHTLVPEVFEIILRRARIGPWSGETRGRENFSLAFRSALNAPRRFSIRYLPPRRII